MKVFEFSEKILVLFCLCSASADSSRPKKNLIIVMALISYTSLITAFVSGTLFISRNITTNVESAFQAVYITAALFSVISSMHSFFLNRDKVKALINKFQVICDSSKQTAIFCGDRGYFSELISHSSTTIN